MDLQGLNELIYCNSVKEQGSGRRGRREINKGWIWSGDMIINYEE